MPPGSTTELSITIAFVEAVKKGDFAPSARLLGPGDLRQLEMKNISGEADVSARQLVYRSTIKAPDQPGIWEIEITFPGQGKHSTYLQTDEASR